MRYVLWVLGWLWMLPMVVIGSLVTLFGRGRFFRCHKDLYWSLHFVAKPGGLAEKFLIKGNFWGYTVGPFVMSLHDEAASNRKHVVHECRHVWQQMVFGVFQPIFYGLNYVWNRVVKKMPHREAYMALLFEVDARKAAEG